MYYVNTMEESVLIEDSIADRKTESQDSEKEHYSETTNLFNIRRLICQKGLIIHAKTFFHLRSKGT